MKKKYKYIQLPPLPEDLEAYAVELIWQFARLHDAEQNAVLLQLVAMLEGTDDKENSDNIIRDILEECSAERENSVMLQYVSTLRKLMDNIGTEACKMAAIIYQKYYVEKSNVEDILQIDGVTEDVLNIFLEYFIAENNKE